MGKETTPPTPGPGAGGGKRPGTVRAQNRLARNAQIRADFARLWTNAPRPRAASREHVLAGLAAAYHLAVPTVEDIVYNADAPPSPPAAPAGPASVPALVRATRQALAVLAQRLAELEAKLTEQ